MSKYISFKDGREIEWLELNLLRTKEPMSKALIISLTSGKDEDDVDDWIKELERRQAQLKKPFYQVSGNILTPLFSWDEIPEYFLCIYYSFNGAEDETNGTKLFEAIAAEALRNFINGETLALGFPEGKGLNAHLDEIAAACKENRNLPAHGSYKDDNVDVVGYKLFGDERSANLYVLLQCAAGKYWKNKKKIELNRWTNYLIWYPENIILSIATVDYVKDGDWEKQSSSFGLLLDRLRIYNCLYEKEVSENLRGDVLEWCLLTGINE